VKTHANKIIKQQIKKEKTNWVDILKEGSSQIKIIEIYQK